MIEQLTMIEQMCDLHQGEICWIIGKGVSLDSLRPEHIGDGPIIALNHAIIKVEELELENEIYSLQADGVHMVLPKRAILLSTAEGLAALPDYHLGAELDR